MIVKIQLFVFPKDDSISTDRRVLDCARGFLGLSEATLSIVRDPYHKPRFAQRDDLFFSVSHSGDLFLCAFSAAPVGVDVEHHKDCNFEQISRRFFHADEYAYLKANDFRDFFSVWTAKESYVKYTGDGIDDRFSKFSTVCDGKLVDRIGDAQLCYVPLREGYSACVCAQQISGISVKFGPESFV